MSFLPVSEPEGEELQTRRLEEEVLVVAGEVVDAGDAVAELADDLDRGREQVVELLDLGRLARNQPVLGLQLLHRGLDVLKKIAYFFIFKFWANCRWLIASWVTVPRTAAKIE